MKTNKILSFTSIIAACALFPAVTHADPIVVNGNGDVSTVPGFSGDWDGSGIPTANSPYTQISNLSSGNGGTAGSVLLAMDANDRYAGGGPVTYAGNNTFDASGQWDFNFFEGINGTLGVVTLNYGVVGGAQNSIAISELGNPSSDSWYNGFSFLTGAGFGSSYDPTASLTYDYSLTFTSLAGDGTVTSQTEYVEQNGGNPSSVPDATSTLPLLGASMVGICGFAKLRRKNQDGLSGSGGFAATA